MLSTLILLALFEIGKGKTIKISRQDVIYLPSHRWGFVHSIQIALCVLLWSTVSVLNRYLELRIVNVFFSTYSNLNLLYVKLMLTLLMQLAFVILTVLFLF